MEPTPTNAHGRTAFGLFVEAIPSVTVLMAASVAVAALAPGRDFRVGVRLALSALILASAVPFAERLYAAVLRRR